ncbi:hypothetical protein ACI2JR_08665 [Klebsiella sp. NPDC088457]
MKKHLYYLSSLLVILLSCNVFATVGFLSPSGINPKFAANVNIAMINVYNEEQLRHELILAEKNGLQLYLDLGPALNTARKTENISTVYYDDNNLRHQKIFKPIDQNKLRALPADTLLKAKISKLLPSIEQYRDNVAAIFLADEPYLNGLNKNDLEHVAAQTRSLLDARGLKEIKLGVIFASAMFNAEFARELDKKSIRYVEGIDNHYRNIAEKIKNNTATDDEKKWPEIIEKFRLTTYDSAGNIYTEGGIPKGFDIYTFDFYLSTILLDNLYNDIPAWFAAKNIDKSCQVFNNKTVAQIRQELSFFSDGAMDTTEQDIQHDKDIMDDLYTCRMNTTIKLLQQEIQSTSPQANIVLISESSSNGVMEFDRTGNLKQGQPEKLVELRVLHEVQRALKLYQDQQYQNISGILFFLFNDEYDNTIKINIGGAGSMPSVLTEIYSLNERE